MSVLEFPTSGSYTLTGARVHGSLTPGLTAERDADGFLLADIAVDDGKVASIARHDPKSAGIALKGSIVLPCFVDCHTHIDKGHIWPRKPNPDGSFPGALNAVGEDRRANWSADDVARRMEFSLACAYAHGTKALRTHLDSVAPQEDISWPVFAAMRERWKGRIELQAACLFGIDEARNEAWFDRLADIVAGHKGVLGAVTYMVPDLDQLLDRIAAAALRHGFDGRILLLQWRERGGPPVTIPTKRGFGSMLLERILGPQLRGAVQIEYPPEGVHVEIRGLIQAPVAHPYANFAQEVVP